MIVVIRYVRLRLPWQSQRRPKQGDRRSGSRLLQEWSGDWALWVGATYRFRRENVVEPPGLRRSAQQLRTGCNSPIWPFQGSQSGPKSIMPTTPSSLPSPRTRLTSAKRTGSAAFCDSKARSNGMNLNGGARRVPRCLAFQDVVPHDHARTPLLGFRTCSARLPSSVTQQLVRDIAGRSASLLGYYLAMKLPNREHARAENT